MSFSEKVTMRTAQIEEAERLQRERREAETEEKFQKGLELRRNRKELLDIGSAVFAALKKRGIGPDIEAVSQSFIDSRPFNKFFKKQRHIQVVAQTTGWLLRQDAHSSGIPVMHNDMFGRSNGGLLSTEGEIMTFVIPPIKTLALNPILERGRFPSLREVQSSLPSSPTRILIEPRLYHIDHGFGLYSDLVTRHTGDPLQDINERVVILTNIEKSDLVLREMQQSDENMKNGLLTLASVHDLEI